MSENLDIEPTAKVTHVGQFPEDESLIQNFEVVYEDEELYNKQKLRDAYAKGLKDGCDSGE